MNPGEFTPCLRCDKPVGEKGGLTFYQVTLQRKMFDPQAVRNTLGLTMIVRSAAVADALNPTPDIAKPLCEPEKFLLCDDCAMRSIPVAALDEMASNRRSDDATDAAASVSATADDDPPSGEAA